MPFVPFQELCPDLARRETRSITLPVGGPDLPAGDYGFFELFCDEAGCDCRRVFFCVISAASRQEEAVIAWGWEDRAFYAKWLGMNDPAMAKEMQGPVLNLCSPQSKNADALLKLAKDLLLSDAAYVERVKRHYALFRAAVGQKVNKIRKTKRAWAKKRRTR